MPPLFWVDIIGLAASTFIAGSLTLLVAGVDPGNRVNRSFGYFTGTMAMWMGAALLLRISLWLEPVLPPGLFLPNTYLWLLVGSISLLLMCIASLMFTATYLDCRTRLTDSAIAFGLLLSIALFVRSLLSPWATIPDIHLSTNGLITYEMSITAKVGLVLSTLYILVSVILFQRERHRIETKYFSLSFLILLVGIIFRTFVHAPFPVYSFSNALCALMLAYGVINRQMLNPLKVRTMELHKEIEERKEAEHKLREAEERYRGIFENAVEGIFQSTVEGSFIAVNPAFAQILGYETPEDLIANVTDIEGELYADPKRYATFIKTLKQKNAVKAFEAEFCRKDGGTAIISMNVRTIRDPEGHILRLEGFAQDVTEKRGYERDLRNSKDQLMQIINFLPDPTFVIDTESRVIAWNHAIEELTGVAAEDILGRGDYEYAVPFYQERRPILIDLTTRWDEKTAKRYKFVRREGDILVSETVNPPFRAGESLFWNTARPLYNVGGKIIGAIEVIRDITHIMESERALRESEEKFRNLVENVNEGIYSLDDRGILAYVNPAIENILGYEESDIIGRPFTDFVHAGDLERQKNRFKRLPSGPIGSDEYRLVNKTGETRWVRSSTRPVFREGELALLEGVLFDITDRKEAEEALIEAQQRYQSLFESKSDMVFVMDHYGNFIDVNDTALEHLGYTKEEFTNLNYVDLLGSDQPVAPIIAAIDEIARTGSHVKPLELKLTDKDGNIIYVETRGTGIPQKKEIFGVAQDITKQKLAEEAKEELERQLLQAQKMEAIGTLAGGIAHDFNNSLQAILGYTQMLLLDTAEEAPEATKLRQIESAALRASELIQQLFTFTRRVESKLRPVDVNREVRQLEKLLRRTIPRMIDIQMHLQTKLRVINADVAQIEQVLMNLGINAVDAMPDGGSLVIETRNVDLDEAYCRTHLGTVPGKYVMLCLSDNGVGMDKDTMEHIFEPFYTTKGPGKGTGLGLAMVYGIVKNHGGTILCYSEPGEGSIFRLFFPSLEDSQARGLEEPEKTAVRGGTETILLVDDEDSVRELAEEMLRRFGYEVLTAADGESALEIYRGRKEGISLIILDLIMPGMGGGKCLEEILKIDPNQKVIVASGYSAKGLRQELLENTVNGYMEKPYEIASMLAAIREAMDQD